MGEDIEFDKKDSESTKIIVVNSEDDIPTNKILCRLTKCCLCDRSVCMHKLVLRCNRKNCKFCHCHFKTDIDDKTTDTIQPESIHPESIQTESISINTEYDTINMNLSDETFKLLQPYKIMRKDLKKLRKLILELIRCNTERRI
jgi:hypothetical protein